MPLESFCEAEEEAVQVSYLPDTDRKIKWSLSTNKRHPMRAKVCRSATTTQSYTSSGGKPGPPLITRSCSVRKQRSSVDTGSVNFVKIKELDDSISDTETGSSSLTEGESTLHETANPIYRFREVDMFHFYGTPGFRLISRDDQIYRSYCRKYVSPECSKYLSGDSSSSSEDSSLAQSNSVTETLSNSSKSTESGSVSDNADDEGVSDSYKDNQIMDTSVVLNMDHSQLEERYRPPQHLPQQEIVFGEMKSRALKSNPYPSFFTCSLRPRCSIVAVLMLAFLLLLILFIILLDILPDKNRYSYRITDNS